MPDFVVIGAMRSGTTTLHQWLRAQPGVFVPPIKELHYFSFNHHRGEAWYTDHFAPCGAEQVAGESSPDYLYSPNAIERMRARIPDVRLVCVLRNPVDRAYSHYWQKRERGNEHLSFEEALAAEPERIQASETDSRNYSYVARGRYHAQLQRVVSIFPRSSLLVLLFDDLTAEPDDTLRRVCAHIGAGESVIPRDPTRRVNAYRGFRSVRLRQATRRLPPVLRDAIGRLNTRDDAYPAMADATRAQLLDELRPDNAALAAWLGRDLSSWDR